MAENNRTRHLDLMAQLGLWSSWTHDTWIVDADGAVAVDIGDPLQSSFLDQTCACPRSPHTPFGLCDKRVRRVRMTKKHKSAVPTLLSRLTTGIIWRYDALPGATVDIPVGGRHGSANVSRKGRRFDLNDGRWFTVQDRFYAGAVVLARPSAWFAIHLPIQSTQKVVPDDHPVIVGTTGGKISALLMPVYAPCDRDWRHAIAPTGAAAASDGASGSERCG